MPIGQSLDFFQYITGLPDGNLWICATADVRADGADGTSYAGAFQTEPCHDLIDPDDALSGFRQVRGFFGGGFRPAALTAAEKQLFRDATDYSEVTSSPRYGFAPSADLFETTLGAFDDTTVVSFQDDSVGSETACGNSATEGLGTLAYRTAGNELASLRYDGFSANETAVQFNFTLFQAPDWGSGSHLNGGGPTYINQTWAAPDRGSSAGSVGGSVAWDSMLPAEASDEDGNFIEWRPLRVVKALNFPGAVTQDEDPGFGNSASADVAVMLVIECERVTG